MIPEELKKLPHWVCWWNNSKIPMQANVMKAASPSDRSTWATYEEASAAVEAGRYDGVGFMFGNGIVGIDIDRGFDEDGFPSEMASWIITACNSFTEVSRSGRGFHIYVKGHLPFHGKNNRKGCEIYASGRFFIVTGNQFLPGVLPDTVEENQGAIDFVLDKYFRDIVTPSGRSARQYEPMYWLTEGRTVPTRPYYPPIEEGCRNQSLASLAGQMQVIGYEPRQIFYELMTVNNTVCDPPLPRKEVINIVSSITRYKGVKK